MLSREVLVMHRASSFLLNSHASRYCSSHVTYRDGFSMAEALVAGVVLLFTVQGTASAFNLITTSISKTSVQSTNNTAIDRDISSIKKLSVEYTSCVVPSGSVPTAEAPCDESSRFSSYYFPMNPTIARQDEFLSACRSTDPAAHITAGFIQAINQKPALASGVIRTQAGREDSVDAKNHNVIVEYKVNNLTVRTVKVSPVVSAWCG